MHFPIHPLITYCSPTYCVRNDHFNNMDGATVFIQVLFLAGPVFLRLLFLAGPVFIRLLYILLTRIGVTHAGFQARAPPQ